MIDRAGVSRPMTDGVKPPFVDEVTEVKIPGALRRLYKLFQGVPACVLHLFVSRQATPSNQ